MELVERCIEGHLGLLVGVVVVVVLLLLTDVPSGGFASLLANEMGINNLRHKKPSEVPTLGSSLVQNPRYTDSYPSIESGRVD